MFHGPHFRRLGGHLQIGLAAPVADIPSPPPTILYDRVCHMSTSSIGINGSFSRECPLQSLHVLVRHINSDTHKTQPLPPSPPVTPVLENKVHPKWRAPLHGHLL